MYASTEDLDPADVAVLLAARQATSKAYAPYSNFRVGAAAFLENGQMLTGSNQENVSYPAGICAKRVLFSAISSTFPGISIESLALSYIGVNGQGDHPISPCGICRQSLQEYEGRQLRPIRLILGGMTGRIYVIDSSANLLPISFTYQQY